MQNLSVLKKSADNLLVLINDILDFNKIEAGKLELEESECQLKPLLAQVVDALQLQASEKGIALSLQADERIPELVEADSLRLQQILTNLCSNAVKFTHKGSVLVSVLVEEETADHTRLQFSVRDTGVGIDPALLPQLFQPFMQASTSITRQFGGTGLGLAITRRLLRLMGSDVQVESEPGKGSHFKFSLSFKKVHREHTTTDSLHGEYNLEGKRILLVEDTPFNVLFATQLLEDWNAVVDAVEHGALAVEKLKQSSYDLVLMDLQMPVMDGYTATVEIRKFNQHVPIVALTASATSNVREKVLQAGMQDYVTKPFNPDEFYHRLKKLL
jgi:CheY-like chemotaxis protein/anti-sigma regulatory factor (Ser/Thr protein kinase)